MNSSIMRLNRIRMHLDSMTLWPFEKVGCIKNKAIEPFTRKKRQPSVKELREISYVRPIFKTALYPSNQNTLTNAVAIQRRKSAGVSMDN